MFTSNLGVNFSNSSFYKNLKRNPSVFLNAQAHHTQTLNFILWQKLAFLLLIGIIIYLINVYTEFCLFVSNFLRILSIWTNFILIATL